MTSSRVIVTISVLVAALLFGCSESKSLDAEHQGLGYELTKVAHGSME
jgi:hypothetical protein